MLSDCYVTKLGSKKALKRLLRFPDEPTQQRRGFPSNQLTGFFQDALGLRLNEQKMETKKDKRLSLGFPRKKNKPGSLLEEGASAQDRM